MTLSSRGVKIFFPQGLFHIKPCARTYIGTKYSICPLNKCIDRKYYLNNFSRRFSLDCFINYPAKLFRIVAESDACAFTKDWLVFIHDFTGLPWWCTIATSAALMKLTCFPWNVYHLRLMDKLQKIIKEMPQISEKVYREVRTKQKFFLWSKQKAHREYKVQIKSEREKLILKNNCHPIKVILCGYVEVPFWIVMSMTWRTMAYGFSDDITSSKLFISQMMKEGPFWCANLTLPDPTYALSILVLLSHFAVMGLSDIQAKLLKRDAMIGYKVVTIFSGCLGILATLVSAYLPSCVAVFWFFSTFLTLIRDLILVSPKVRRYLKLPFQNFSYQEILEALKDKYLKKVI